MKTSHHGQMSESFLTAVFLSLSGGLQDAYTYLFRGKVFANAQTGNIVLLSANLMDGNWERVLHYLVPLCAFALGVLTAEKMRERFREMRTLHWRQLVVLGEGLLLFLVGFLPQEQNLLANAIVSFACAMQVQAFRKVNGYAFASTMCIGDLRSGVEALCIWRKTHEPQARDRMLRYFGIILLFAIGAGIGSRSAALLGGRAIWICCGFLLVSFALMFIREDLEENPVIEKDLTEIRQETREINHALKQELQEEHREQKMYAGADGDAVPEEFREARNKGLYYLQFSGKTENEMRKKLAEQGFSPASVEDAVLFLKHYRYLDDEDYARRYVEKNDHKKSIRQMKFDLRQKGVSDDLVEMVFEDMEVDESAQILGLLRKKNYDPEEPDPAKRQKIYAFLARKGFSYDAINSAMKQWE